MKGIRLCPVTIAGKYISCHQDYRELAEIALVLLGGELPGGKDLVWKKPGATHKARFLAFGLLALKIWA